MRFHGHVRLSNATENSWHSYDEKTFYDHWRMTSRLSSNFCNKKKRKTIKEIQSMIIAVITRRKMMTRVNIVPLMNYNSSSNSKRKVMMKK